MNALTSRLLGYGGSGVLAGLLIYGGFVHETDPDLLTMLGSVEVQLAQASLMTAASEKDEGVASARAELLTNATNWLDRVDAAYPDSAWSSWYRAYMAYLDGRYPEAAGLYEETRFRRDCPDDLRDKAVLNQALMLREVGRHAAAAALLRQHRGRFLDEFAATAQAHLAAAEEAARVAAETSASRDDAAAAPPGK